jgi:quinol monooxygenase YgiN
MTQAHLDKHAETPHIQNLVARTDELCAGPLKLDFWKKIG